MWTGSSRQWWERAGHDSLPGLHALEPTGRQTDPAGLPRRPTRRVVGGKRILHPDGTDAQHRRGPAHILEGDACGAGVWRRESCRTPPTMRHGSFSPIWLEGASGQRSLARARRGFKSNSTKLNLPKWAALC
jgi:hypothetical protein